MEKASSRQEYNQNKRVGWDISRPTLLFWDHSATGLSKMLPEAAFDVIFSLFVVGVGENQLALRIFNQFAL